MVVIELFNIFCLQAILAAATSDGVDESGHSSRWASQEFIGGQRWCQTDCQASPSRAGLWTKTAEVNESTHMHFFLVGLGHVQLHTYIKLCVIMRSV